MNDTPTRPLAPRIDARQLISDLDETAKFGATAEGGVSRLTLTPEDVQVRTWFAEAVQNLGGTIRRDKIGNMFALFPGQDPSLPPLAFGSHLDTQPTGGRFDGILGVLGGLAVVRALKAAERFTRHPLCLINWTNEEGARFAPTMLGSGVHAGIYEMSSMMKAIDRDGITLSEALERSGEAGLEQPGGIELSAWVELHIEQGPVLERMGRQAAAVVGVQGLRWYEVQILGRAAHAGTTPRQDRQDAFLAAARLALDVDREITELGGLVTFGEIQIPQASRNVVPGEVRLSVDLRHQENKKLDQMEEVLREHVTAVGRRALGMTSSIRSVFKNAPVRFDQTVINAVRSALVDEHLPDLTVVSGAGHDAVNLSYSIPTAMIFVPSRDGISHNPKEFTSSDDCVLGAQLLLNAVLHLDEAF